MSMFAFGVGILKTRMDIIPLAHEIVQYNETLPFHVHLKFGGNADSYLRYCRDNMIPGLHFELTSSIVENTAEDLFVQDAPGAKNTTAIYLQQLFQFMFSSGSVIAVRFYIVGDYEPIRDDMLIHCSCDEFKSYLGDYCINDYGQNMYFEVMP